MTIRSRMSSIMVQTDLTNWSFSPLKDSWIWLCLHSSIYKYKLTSTKLCHNECHHKMSSIMDLIGPEQSELSALELEKLLYLTCLHSSICKYRPISTNRGQNRYDRLISNEFDYGSHLTRTTRTICPWFWRNRCFWLCLHSSIYKC